jgi:L-asparagine oxygenase
MTAIIGAATNATFLGGLIDFNQLVHSQDLNPTFSVLIDNKISDELGATLRTLPSPYEGYEDFLLRMLPIFTNLPQGVLRSIMTFRHDPTAPGAMLIRNLPRDLALPDTPSLGKRAVNKCTYLSEACLLGIGQLLGEVFSYKNEKNGELIHNICPVKGKQKAVSNEGAIVDFLLHTEDAYFDFRPHYLFLICLRTDGQREAATYVADARDACQYLRHEELAQLQKPQFAIRIPESFESINSEVQWSKAKPVLTGPDELPEVCLNLNCMMALTSEAELALNAFRHALNLPDVVKSIYLEPGDILLINNRKAVHGRKPFTPQFDGKDRWLQRVYIRTDLWEGRSSPNVDLRIF